MRNLLEYFRLFLLTIKTVLKLKKQQVFVKRFLLPIISKYQKDSALSEYDVYKIVHYYSLGVVVLLGDYFCILRGKELSMKERKSLTFMAAISTIYDDFFDKTGHEKAVIESMTYDPENFKPNGFRETLFNELTLEALHHIGLKSLLDSTRKQLLEVQWLTKGQSDKNEFSWGQLKENTMKKGGWSFLFYRSALSNDISEEEKALVFQIGGLLQYSNDIFDVYKDREEGVFTQVNSVTDIGIVVKDFNVEMEKTFKMCRSSSYSTEVINELLQNLYLLCARNMVCLNQLQDVQINHGGTFNVQSLSRQELVCDMEKTSNLLKMAKSYLTFAKRD
ncbi:MAG: hypothetical protein ACJAZ2_000356 [Glaciecola sp.]|jgi:hypothetical protein